ncbi:MAG: hypothetical protein HYT79_07210 [Elusimicrobia bacterium]|nr:hypothetical protein [Elusimicrobiota bacterium]
MRQKNAPVFLLACLLGLAPQAWGWDDSYILGEINVLLNEISGLSRESELGTEIIIGSVSGDHNAIFDDNTGRVIINRQKLEQAQTYMEAMPNHPTGDDVPKVLARHFFPTVAHELRHAHIHREIPGVQASKEDEIAAFINNMLAYHALRKKYPQDMSVYDTPQRTAMYRIYTQYWIPDGVDGLKSMVSANKAYKAYPSLNNNEDVSKWKEKIRNAQTVAIPIEEQYEDDGDWEAACRALSAISNGPCGNASQLRARFAEIGEAAGFWLDDEGIEEAKTLYNDTEFPRGERLWNRHSKSPAN